MDKQKFIIARDKIVNAQQIKNGIGTLGEKTLHAVLKNYFEQNESNHEIKVGSFVADIMGSRGIIEIQTRSFDKLRKKLKFFLDMGSVTIVYPIAGTKWISWIDRQSGDACGRRKSPKQGKLYDAFYELYKIKQLLTHPNIVLCIVLLDVEEYRCLNGWSKDKKRGATRHDTIPVNLVDEVYFGNRQDYIKMIPQTLHIPFTSHDYKQAAGIKMNVARTALNVLNYMGVVRRVGRRERMYLYEVVDHV